MTYNEKTVELLNREKFQNDAIDMYEEAVRQGHDFGYVISGRIFDVLVKPLIEKAVRQSARKYASRKQKGGRK